MKVLVAGNSQAGCLKVACEQNKELFSHVGELFFYVVPGGTGPYFTVKDDRLVVTMSNSAYPPYVYPADAGEQPLSSFDAIVISALGYVDGGFAFDNPIIRQGLMVDFAPLKSAPDLELISDACYRVLVEQLLRRQPGFAFASILRRNFHGRVIVQPFPYPSEGLKGRQDWKLRALYDDFVGAHRFLCGARNEALANFCRENDLELLDHPDCVTDDLFSRSSLMRATDEIHSETAYGEMVIKQLAERLQAEPARERALSGFG